MLEREHHSPAATSRARSLRRRMTWSEQALWKELRKLDANIRRQAPIGRYVVDFACHGRSLVIEVDGGVHERLDEVALRDGERQLWLQDQGYRVLRFTDGQVHNDLLGCVRTVRGALGLPEGVDEVDPGQALLLDGGGLGGGVGSAPGVLAVMASAPTSARSENRPANTTIPGPSSIEEEGSLSAPHPPLPLIARKAK